MYISPYLVPIVLRKVCQTVHESKAKHEDENHALYVPLHTEVVVPAARDNTSSLLLLLTKLSQEHRCTTIEGCESSMKCMTSSTTPRYRSSIVGLLLKGIQGAATHGGREGRIGEGAGGASL